MEQSAVLDSPVGSEEINRDPLTEALPKACFDERLRQATERARLTGTPLSLLAIDLDHFKSVNDAFGHVRGDEVLREFAERVHTLIRGSDLLFRCGGDEFALLLPETARPQALALARRILEQIRREPFSGTPPLTVSLSIGVASFPDDAEGPDELFGRADHRLYEAKRRGRGQLVGEDRTSTISAPLGSTSRLIERDRELEAMYGFLHGLPGAKRGVFTAWGSPGSGRSRFLAEVRSAGKLLGYDLLALHATPALRGRAFGALLEADPSLQDQVSLGRNQILRALEARYSATGRSGLLLVIDEIGLLDEATVEILQHLFHAPGVPTVGLACTSDQLSTAWGFASEASWNAAVELRPISADGLRTWLRSTLQWEPSADLLNWLHGQTGGLPRMIQGTVSRLVQQKILLWKDDQWNLDPRWSRFSLRESVGSRGKAEGADLPAPVGSLVGRDSEIRQIKRLLGEYRLLTLVGPGGFGKTRLALQVAAEQHKLFPDGVFWVPLAPVSSREFMVPAISEALGFTFQTAAESKQQLFDYLRKKQLLLVLDNFEHLIDGAPLISELLSRAPGVRLLVTSRERLDVEGESLFEVPGMAVPEGEHADDAERSTAVQMFVQQARQHQADFTLTEDKRPYVVQICRLLQGIPLAIELAAALVRVLSCEEIAAEVAHDLDSLTSSRRDVPERHRSLRAVFESSWQLLSEREQRVLRQLSLLRGGFRRQASQQIAGASLPVLSSLVNKSLLHRTPAGRYQIHEVLRHYALEHLNQLPEEREETEAARCRYFAEFVYSRGERRKGGAC